MDTDHRDVNYTHVNQHIGITTRASNACNSTDHYTTVTVAIQLLQKASETVCLTALFPYNAFLATVFQHYILTVLCFYAVMLR